VSAEDIAGVAEKSGFEVGLYKLNSVDPELESAWFLQPLSL
jgi:hypothetical protein